MNARSAWFSGFALLVVWSSTVAAQAPPAPVKASGREPTVTFGGLLQVQGEGGDAGDSRFGTAGDRIYLRRARLTATARFLEEFDVRVEAEFEGSLAPAAGLRAQLTDAYINWSRYPGADVKVGQFKTPFGYEQLYSDPRLPLIERALPSDRLTLSRQTGVQIGGDFVDKRYGYAVGFFDGGGTNTSSNDDNRFAKVVRGWTRLARGKSAAGEWSWTASANGYESHDKSVAIADLGFDSTPTTPDKDGLFAGKRRGYGLDTQLVVGPVEIWAEMFRTRFEPDDVLPRREFDAKGASLLASWMFVPNRWQAVVRYESFDPFDGLENDDTTTWTLGTSYLLKGQDLKVMANLFAVDAPARDREERLLVRLQAIF